jgi:hypothetical protein
MLVMLALSVPVAYSLGLSSVLLMVNQDIGHFCRSQKRSPDRRLRFLAIPIVYLAGFLMEGGGIQKDIEKWPR